MLLNFFLLVCIYASRKLKGRGYLVALTTGLIKGIIYLMFGSDVAFAGVIALVFAAVACLVHFLLVKLTAKQDYVTHYSMPSTPSPKKNVQWEYVPLAVLFIVVVFAMP